MNEKNVRIVLTSYGFAAAIKLTRDGSFNNNYRISAKLIGNSFNLIFPHGNLTALDMTVLHHSIRYNDHKISDKECRKSFTSFMVFFWALTYCGDEKIPIEELSVMFKKYIYN